MTSFCDSYATGISFMDEGTKRYINEMNKLSDEMKSGQGRDYVPFALDFLGDYCAKHLLTEEKVMIKCRFHDIENHAVQHDEFRAELEKIGAEYEKRGADPSFPLMIQRFMAGWLLRHVSKTDKVLGDFLIALAKKKKVTS